MNNTDFTDNSVNNDAYSQSGDLLPYSDKYISEEEDVETDDFQEKKSDERYNEIFSKSKHKTRLWSVISLALAIAALATCFLGLPGLILAVLAVVMSLVSRKALGYFDGISIGGFISGIFGTVFSAVKIIIQILIQ